MSTDPSDDIQRCINEQRACRQYLDGDGPDRDGAWAGLTDWQMEEAILRSELPKPYYDDGKGIVIYNADCREILPLLPKVDLVLTDPPYGVDYSTWDRSVPRPQDWLYRCIAVAKTVYVTPGNGQAVLYPHPTWTMAWFRPGSVQRVREGTGFSHWEPILVYGKFFSAVDARQIKAVPQPDAKGHPCPKPIELFSWLVTPDEFQVVLDPFMGSGTTLVAAKQLGRRAIGIEIEEKYCEIAAERLRQEVFDFAPPQPEPEQVDLFATEEPCR